MYDKLGKLINKYPYSIKDQKISGTIPGQQVIATAEKVPDPPSVAKEKITESETIPASFPGGNEAYCKFIIDNFDTSVTETEGMIKMELNLTIDKDGTVSLENQNQKIYSEKDLSDEMKHVLKNSPKWNPETQNGIPVKSLVRFPVTINIQ